MAASRGFPDLPHADPLAQLQDIFSGRIDPDVVQLILAECDSNVNTALETLFTLSQDSAATASTGEDSAFTQSPSTFHPTTISSPDDCSQLEVFLDHAYQDQHHRSIEPFHGVSNSPASASSFRGQRVSTIYKSNEALYFEDVAHDHDFNCGVISPSAPSVECLRSFAFVPSAPERDDGQRIAPTRLLKDPSKGNGATRCVLLPSSAFNGHHEESSAAVLLGELRDHLSPDSDRSIEADASESVDLRTAAPLIHKILNCDVEREAGGSPKSMSSSRSGDRNGAGRKSPGPNYFQERKQSPGKDVKTAYGTLPPEMQRILSQSLSPQLRDALFAGKNDVKVGGPPAQRFVAQPQRQKTPVPLLPDPLPTAGFHYRLGAGTALLPDPLPTRGIKRVLPKEIATNKIQSGAKVLIIMRGLPGSGKSTLARELMALKDGGIVLSTDDFFVRNGIYSFDGTQLPQAHNQTRERALQAMRSKRTPIIIDNTNTQAWEMIPYVAAGLQYGYFFWLMQPETSWRFNVPQLAVRNTHDVRAENIQRMLERFDHSLGSEKLKNLAQEFLKERGGFPGQHSKGVPLAASNPPDLRGGASNGPATRNTANFRPQEKKGVKASNPRRQRRPPKGHRGRPTGPVHPSPGGTRDAFAASVSVQRSGDDIFPPGTDCGVAQSTVEWPVDGDALSWSSSSSSSSYDDFEDADWDCKSTQSSIPDYSRHNQATLHKSKSVPNLADVQTEAAKVDGQATRGPRWPRRSTSRHEKGSFVVPEDEKLQEINLMLMEDGGTGTTSLLDEWDGIETDAVLLQPFSDNMRDLLTIDFGCAGSAPCAEESSSATSVTSISTNATTTTTSEEKEVVSEDVEGDVGAEDSLLRNLKLNTNWCMPAYPGSTTTTPDLPPVISSSNHSSSSGVASEESGAAKRVDSDGPNSGGDEFSVRQSREKQLGALQAFFANISLADLADIFDNCNGDIQWTVNTLLDAGYEMNSSPSFADRVDEPPIIVQPLKSESSLEGLAELTLDDDRCAIPGHGPLSNVARSPEVLSDVDSSKVVFPDDLPPPPSSSSSSSWTSEATGYGQRVEGSGNKIEDLVLRIDPVFAIQLERMFGPVAFHLEPASYCGEDLKMTVSKDVARSIHACWEKSLQEKFQAEESELKSMTTDEDFVRQIQEAEDASSAMILEPDPLGQHFPQLEKQKLIYLLQQKEMPNKTNNIASRIKRRQLFDMFPKIDPKFVDQVFEANEGSFSETVIAIQDSYKPDEKPQLVIAPSQLEEYENALVKLALQESLAQELDRTKGASKSDEDFLHETTYDELRAEASIHYYLRQECYQKAQEAYGKNMKSVASYYSQQGHTHTQKFKDANAAAAKKILEIRNAGLNGKKLDLHSLHVPEAMQALISFLEEKKRELRSGSNPRMTVYIITGKGNNSATGMPRIKPAVIDYLVKHNFSFSEPNGGRIEVIISKQLT